MKKGKKPKNQINNNMLYINAILLFAALIISNIIVENTFNIGEYSILMSVFSFPFVYFFANRITKNYGPGKSLIVLFIALLVQGVYYFISTETGTTIPIETILGSIISFGISQLINLAIYNNLLTNKKLTLSSLSLTYFIALLIDNLVFFLIIEGQFDLGFIYALAIRFLVGFALAFTETKILNKK